MRSACTGGYPTAVNLTTVQVAIQDGFLLILPNTRTGAGWYSDSAYTGPQEQDILDAIDHEQQLRSVGALYLYGFSMGSIGAVVPSAIVSGLMDTGLPAARLLVQDA